MCADTCSSSARCEVRDCLARHREQRGKCATGQDSRRNLSHDRRASSYTDSMKTVVLVGFSCAGKTTVGKAVKARWGVEVRESDVTIASPESQGEPHPGDPHVYKVFFAHGRERALELIEQREREFLRELKPSSAAQLVVTGPAVPSRIPDWEDMIARVRPEFVYLELTPDEALGGLFERRATHAAIPDVARHPLFGSWDEGVTTYHVDGAWRAYTPAEALVNVTEAMRQLRVMYEAATPAANRFAVVGRDDPAAKEELVCRVGSLLGY